MRDYSKEYDIDWLWNCLDTHPQHVLSLVIMYVQSLTHPSVYSVQAVDQLKVAYGVDHPSTLEALELLHTSQVELAHRQNQDTQLSD